METLYLWLDLTLALSLCNDFKSKIGLLNQASTYVHVGTLLLKPAYRLMTYSNSVYLS